MAELPDHMPAAAGRGDLRASHADRERVIGTLKAAFVQGRLAKDEFNLRVGRALSARTYADLAALTADIAAVPAAAESARPPAPALRRPLARAAAGSGSCLVVAFGAVQLIQLADPGATPGPIPKALVGPPFLVLFASVIAALAILGHGVAPPRWTSGVTAGGCRRGGHLARAVRHLRACHQPTRAGSFHRPPPVPSAPKLHEAVAAGRSRQARGHCADGALAGCSPGNGLPSRTLPD